VIEHIPTLGEITEAFQQNPRLYLSVGPMTGAMLLKKFLIRNRAMQMVIFGGATIATIRIVIGPYMDQVTQHWMELRTVLAQAL
jgi:hypothetical protein